MDFLKGKSSELTVWQLLLVVGLGAALVYVLGSIVKGAIIEKSLVVTPGGNTFIKTSFGPLAKADYDKAALAYDKGVADKAAKASKTT